MNQDEFMRLARLLDEVKQRLDAKNEIEHTHSEREQPDHAAQPPCQPPGQGPDLSKFDYWRGGNWRWIALILLTCIGVIVWIKSH
jgi:hypothetical protein